MSRFVITTYDPHMGEDLLDLTQILAWHLSEGKQELFFIVGGEKYKIDHHRDSKENKQEVQIVLRKIK